MIINQVEKGFCVIVLGSIYKKIKIIMRHLKKFNESILLDESKIKGKLKYDMQGSGSKSEGYVAYLELPDESKYKLYRKGVYEINDEYFKEFNNKEVVVDGEIQKNFILVKNIKLA